MKKLFFSEVDKKEIQRFREELSNTRLELTEMADLYGSAAGGGCGGLCRITCSHWCAQACQTSCATNCGASCWDLVAGGCIEE